MKCPVDGTTLTMTDRSGVEIDYCPQCRGLWLDRGELDKLLDRAGREEDKRSVPRTEAREAPRRDERRDEPRHDEGKRYPKKRESWWSDILDF